MSGLFNRLPQFPPSPPGIEREVLRAMPKLTLYGSAVFLLPAALMRLWYGWSWPLSGEQALISTDIFLISLLILYWTVLFTVALGAFIPCAVKPRHSWRGYQAQTAKPFLGLVLRL